MIACPCLHLNKQEQCGRRKRTSNKILCFVPGVRWAWGQFPLHPWLVCWVVTPHLLGITLPWSRPGLCLTQQFKFSPPNSHAFTWNINTAVASLVPDLDAAAQGHCSQSLGEQGGSSTRQYRRRRPWGCSMLGHGAPGGNRWKPQQAELSAAPRRDLAAPWELHVVAAVAVWVFL